MTKAIDIILTSVATLVVAGITASVAWYVRKRSDTVRLRGRLSTGSAVSLIQSVGCPCMTLTVTNKAKRTAKIKSASLLVRNADVIDQFQQGFGEGFGFTRRPDQPTPLATLGIGLLPIAKPTSPHGWALERDDVCEFILPLLTPGLGVFHNAPSHDLVIEVTFFDDSKHELMRGDGILNALRTFVEMYRGHPYRLNPRITIPISLQVESMTLPDPAMIGTTNPNAIPMQPRTDKD